MPEQDRRPALPLTAAQLEIWLSLQIRGNYIEREWTDMRPASLVRAMSAAAEDDR